MIKNTLCYTIYFEINNHNCYGTLVDYIVRINKLTVMIGNKEYDILAQNYQFLLQTLFKHF